MKAGVLELVGLRVGLVVGLIVAICRLVHGFFEKTEYFSDKHWIPSQED